MSDITNLDQIAILLTEKLYAMIDEEIEDYDDFLDYVKYGNLGYKKGLCDSYFSSEWSGMFAKTKRYFVYRPDCGNLFVFHKGTYQTHGPYGIDGIRESPYQRNSREYFWYTIGYMFGMVDRAKGSENSYPKDLTAAVISRMWKLLG